ncbi:MAG TPA: glycosyltransferase family 4 protein [Saprospiraceae bacterium]|nr:glycosyltransferase family 4 protein [Saprospiraceae bacterium]
MKILQICKKNPFPPRDGETKAIDILARGLMSRGVELCVLSFNTTKHYVSQEAYEKAPYPIETIHLDNHLNYTRILWDYFRGYSPNFKRFHSVAMEKRIENLLKEHEFDLIQLEGSYLLPYVDVIRKHSAAPLVVRTHNVEYQIWQRLANGEHGIKKWMFNAMAGRMKDFELEKLAEVDALLPISVLDEASFKKAGIAQPMLTVPMGVQLNGARPSRSTEDIQQTSMAFLGSMDWEPNKEGVNWFLHEVWPELKKEAASAEFFLAGRNMPAKYYGMNDPGLVVLGEVDCPREYLRDKSAVVIPLLSGSGMRIKAIEAMELCVPLVSSSIGIEGIPANNGEHLLIADTPREMKDAIRWIWKHPEEAEAMAKRAQELVYTHFNMDVLTDRMLAFYQQMLSE